MLPESAGAAFELNICMQTEELLLVCPQLSAEQAYWALAEFDFRYLC